MQHCFHQDISNSLSPLSGWRDETGPCLWHFTLTVEATQVTLDDALPQLPIPSPPQPAPADVVLLPRKHKHVAVSTRKQKRVSVSTRKLNWSCHAAVRQRRHKSWRRLVMFLLPAHHVNKDSTIWWHVHCKERTTYCINPRGAHSPAPIISPLTGHPHPSQGIHPSHQCHWGRLLSVLHLLCSPGCHLSRPCSRYSFRSTKPGSSQHWGLSWILSCLSRFSSQTDMA